MSVDEGGATEALARLRQSLAIYRELALEYDTADSLNWFAAALAAAGSPRTATALLARALMTYEEIGTGVRFWIAPRNEKTLAAIHDQLDAAAFAEAWQKGRALTIEEAVELALGETNQGE